MHPQIAGLEAMWCRPNTRVSLGGGARRCALGLARWIWMAGAPVVFGPGPARATRGWLIRLREGVWRRGGGACSCVLEAPDVCLYPGDLVVQRFYLRVYLLYARPADQERRCGYLEVLLMGTKAPIIVLQTPSMANFEVRRAKWPRALRAGTCSQTGILTFLFYLISMTFHAEYASYSKHRLFQNLRSLLSDPQRYTSIEDHSQPKYSMAQIRVGFVGLSASGWAANALFPSFQVPSVRSSFVITASVPLQPHQPRPPSPSMKSKSEPHQAYHGPDGISQLVHDPEVISW
ncbi:transcription regulator gal [Salix suchowensis]|nr:transcription regulator gal [Salix suchowensis]